jgi:hypothetical protein
MKILNALAAGFCLAAASTASAMNAEELIAKNIEARGGLEKIQAIDAVRASGRMVYAEGDFSIEMAYLNLVRADAGCRTEIALQGLTAITAYDGGTGWNVSPFQGRRDPERMSTDDAKSLEYCADLDGPLVDWQAKGHQVEYQGTEDVDGTEAHKLKVTLKNGDVQTMYFDRDYFLEIRSLMQTTVRGVKQEQETDVGNYERVNGVYLPFSIESGPKGGPKSQKVEIEKIEAGVEIDPAQFAFPTR